jgi:hypothetical protein
MRDFMLGLFSSEEIDPVQLAGKVFAAVEEGRGVIRLGLGGLWRLFGLFSRRCPVVYGGRVRSLTCEGHAFVRRANRVS